MSHKNSFTTLQTLKLFRLNVYKIMKYFTSRFSLYRGNSKIDLLTLELIIVHATAIWKFTQISIAFSDRQAVNASVDWKELAVKSAIDRCSIRPFAPELFNKNARLGTRNICLHAMFYHYRYTLTNADMNSHSTSFFYIVEKYCSTFISATHTRARTHIHTWLI